VRAQVVQLYSQFNNISPSLVDWLLLFKQTTHNNQPLERFKNDNKSKQTHNNQPSGDIYSAWSLRRVSCFLLLIFCPIISHNITVHPSLAWE
jgi:hypothetical protein